ncbi:apocytochrome f [Oculatella sp. FACHB-28]|uniref:cytochrome f n=1 Tax=Cyanophyceae TaxID=3028117 RepID=UPI001689A80B|nr:MULTISPECIES: apocytochrome f [Cyanophyceae]MBD1868564.1 apocytochrome f [Cyanobacteria bacterium FACHB-471]MBD2000465.1 apocytochrome f [Leptolyngbya sp. FACHB-541]MBD2060106.1 apocytochrome f [Oculatella sp. FACHB-28]MBD2066789.1 apocytochrome f [Leptolyngbya sp. FACHB-671]
MKSIFWSILPQSGRAIAKSMLVAIATLALLVTSDFAFPQTAAAYPFWAQQNYDNPREATGRIVCANCHLGAKPTEVEVPQSVLPDSVFKAVVKIPYDTSVQQVQGNGEKGPLNVGAVLMLPEGFKIAPPERIPEEMKEEVGESYLFQPYSETQENIVLVGPLPGEQYQEIVFPVLAPDPGSDKSVYFGKYQIHVGGNRGRGQVYPTGEKSNNAVYNASVAGTIAQVTKAEDGGYQVKIQPDQGEAVVDTIPAGPELVVSEGETVAAGSALTSNPNVGGFGQKDVEIVLQSPNRIKGLLAFMGAVTLSQILLVLKKKQVEKVQAAEMNF